jgi:hypothetical protein
LFADAVNEGFALIKQHIETLAIACDYQPKPCFLYAENEEEVKLLGDIYKGAMKVGVPVQYANDAPTPVLIKKRFVLTTRHNSIR